MVALVRNPAVTLQAYGSYVTPVPGNIGTTSLEKISESLLCKCKLKTPVSFKAVVPSCLPVEFVE